MCTGISEASYSNLENKNPISFCFPYYHNIFASHNTGATMVAHHPLSLNNMKPFTICARNGGTLSFIAGIP